MRGLIWGLLSGIGAGVVSALATAGVSELVRTVLNPQSQIQGQRAPGAAIDASDVAVFFLAHTIAGGVLAAVPAALIGLALGTFGVCLLYTSPSPRDKRQSRMPSSA